jgi:hypothetical protein
MKKLGDCTTELQVCHLSQGVHAQMASDIQSGNYEAAAQRAMQNPEFYNTVFKEHV